MSLWPFASIAMRKLIAIGRSGRSDESLSGVTATTDFLVADTLNRGRRAFSAGGPQYREDPDERSGGQTNDCQKWNQRGSD
jgi:hypothetical protein